MDSCIVDNCAERRSSSDDAQATTLTPPSSTVRKPGTPVKRTKKLHPLSPALSSPIRPQKARKLSHKGDTHLITTRSSNSQTLEELIETFTDEKRLALLQDSQRKPPFSYAMLIGLAILQSEEVRLTLSQIYHWITHHFPFYKLSDYGWQNSIRHNLSLNEAFVKGDKSSDGKGHYWQVKPGCEGKFFKSGLSDEEIRSKLSKLCFNVMAATAEQQTAHAADSLARELFTQTDPESVNERHRMKGKKLEEPCELEISTDEDSDAEDMHNPLLDVPSSPSPFASKHDSSDQDAFIDNCVSDFTNATAFSTARDTNPGFNLSFSPTEEIKKYSCSFNTSFDGSPHAKTPKMTSSPCGNFGSPEPHQMTSRSTTDSLDLLKTPQIKPVSRIDTPRDPNSTRKWRTPSALVDDFTRSPLLINMSRTPMLLGDHSSTDGVMERVPLTGQSHKYFENIRYTSGLFGVDVCSVWKRAVESGLNSAASTEPAGQHNRLDMPFQALHE
ncbi:LAME_0H15082g1_1 [Lachancea meyersii CBS 8951]|uniref:LAME_0H15082g1_1 n=1 Tax=Lachancea meyersii CBS 8951 TaxID=1266667 RepID=A0A1G4KHY0_9SACH|nr:LAME_0H15082g1_1 [Lachancea meyersii CBS 8951]